MHQHRNRHRTHTAGHGCNRTAFRSDFGERDIADKLRAFWRRRIGDPVDSYINHHRAFLHHVGFHKFRLADCGDQNIRATADRGQIARSRMRDGHRGVAAAAFIHQQKGQRFSNDHRAAEDNHICTGGLDSALDKQSLAAEWRARNERVRVAQRDLGDVDGVETVHVFARIDGLDDGPLVDGVKEAISRIIGAGIIPAALEMMDQGIIGALEEAFSFGFPLDAGAVLIIEVDGLDCVVEDEAVTIIDLCMQAGAREVKRSKTEEERLMLWKCRKQAFGAIGRLAPSCCTQDGVVPRTRLPEILEFITETERRHNIRIVNVFHAGDGNIHPILLFDERDKDQIHRVIEASEEILNRCIDLGGSVTGEHGIGVEKISLMKRLFTETDLEVMTDIRKVFNPKGLCSPGKMLPTAGGCGSENPIKVSPSRRAAF